MKKFTKKNDKVEPGFNIGVVLNRKETRGQLGLELEFEGKKLPKELDTPLPWVYHKDNSLRGEESGEYVLDKPIMFDQLPAALDTLWVKFKELKSKFDDSNRTSVHVHLNCQEFHMPRLTAFASLYFIFEEMLVEWCGEYRIGNLFCLRGIDAPAIVTSLRKFIQTDGEFGIAELMHYSAFNANALHKYGSIEIRTLRGVHDKKVILDWVSMIQRLYDLSAEFKDPREIAHLYSSMGAQGFFDMVWGDKGSILLGGISFTHGKIYDSMYEGILLAQGLCYCRDWAKYKEVKIKRDPFGRNMKSIIRKLSQEDMPPPVEDGEEEGFLSNAYITAVNQLGNTINSAPHILSEMYTINESNQGEEEW